MQGFIPILINSSLREKRKGGPGCELIMNSNIFIPFKSISHIRYFWCILV